MSVSTQKHPNADQHDKPEKKINVTVNGHTVVFIEKKATGAQIKATAIAQGTPNIQADFLLFEKKGPDHQKQIGDDETVNFHDGQEFQAIADDDNA